MTFRDTMQVIGENALARIDDIALVIFGPKKGPNDNIFCAKVILGMLGFSNNKFRNWRCKNKRIVGPNVMLTQIIGASPVILFTTFRSVPTTKRHG